MMSKDFQEDYIKTLEGMMKPINVPMKVDFVKFPDHAFEYRYTVFAVQGDGPLDELNRLCSEGFVPCDRLYVSAPMSASPCYLITLRRLRPEFQGDFPMKVEVG